MGEQLWRQIAIPQPRPGRRTNQPSLFQRGFIRGDYFRRLITTSGQTSEIGHVAALVPGRKKKEAAIGWRESIRFPFGRSEQKKKTERAKEQAGIYARAGLLVSSGYGQKPDRAPNGSWFVVSRRKGASSFRRRRSSFSATHRDVYGTAGRPTPQGPLTYAPRAHRFKS